MTDRPFRGVIVVLLACALSACAKQQSTMRPPPEVNPPPPVEASATKRVDALGDLARQLTETAERLPGRSPAEYRAIMQQAFAQLAQVLPILYGPNPNGSQRQQLTVVESARAHLASAPQDLAPEPTIDTGLRAARDALESVGRNSFYDQAHVGQTLDRLSGVIPSLDATRGVLHQQAVTQSVELMAQAITQMAIALNERLDEQQAPSTQPATAPPASGTR